MKEIVVDPQNSKNTICYSEDKLRRAWKIPLTPEERQFIANGGDILVLQWKA